MDFKPGTERFGDLALKLPAGIPVVTVVLAGIEPMATTSIGGPVAEFLLKQHRKKDLGLAIAQPLPPVSGGKLDRRENGDLWEPAVLMNKTIFETKLRVTVADMGASVRWLVISERHHEVEMHVREHSIVHIQVRSRAG